MPINYEALFGELGSHMGTLERNARTANSPDVRQRFALWTAMMTIRRVLTDTGKAQALRQMLRDSQDRGRWLAILTRVLTVLRLMYQNQVPSTLTNMVDQTINTIEDFLRTNAWQ